MPRVAPAVLAVAACLAVAPAADAASKPLRCKSGFGKLALNGKQRCVRSRQLLPRVPAASNPWLPFARWAVLQPEQHVFTTRVGGKIVPLPSFGIAAPSVNAALQALKGYGDTLQVRLTGQAAPRRAVRAGRRARLADGPVVTLGPAVVSESATGASVSGTMTSRDAAAGVTTTVELGAHAQKGKDGKIDPTATSMDITFGVATDAGKSVTFTFSVPANGKDVVADRCPSATGVVRRDTNVSTRSTTNDTSEAFVQENSEAKTMSLRTRFRGFVDEDAKLERINYEIHTRYSSTRRARVLFGIFDIVTRIRIGVDAAGSVNGRTGAITKGQTNVTVTFNSTELSAAQIAAEVRSALADGSLRAKMEQMASDMAARAYASMKETEKHWRTPNACARATFSPASAIVHSGSSKTIRGTVRAESGRAAAGKWKRLAIGPGTVVSGLAGTSSATSPISVRVKGGNPSAAGITVLLKTRTVSRAGIAETVWRADGDVPDLYYKIDDVTYSAGYTGSFSGPIMDCLVTGSSSENAHITTVPFDGALDRLQANGQDYTGGLGIPNGSTALRNATMHGCDLASGSPPAPCTSMPSLSVPIGIGLSVDMPAKQRATISWVLPQPIIGGALDLDGTCYVPPITTIPAIPTTKEDRTVFLDPGQHIISVTRPVAYDVSAGGVTVIQNGSATVHLKFHRVNADGSPFTG